MKSLALLDLADDHDAAHIDAALAHVTDFSLAVDGGAHKGIFTRKMAARFEKVWAFEPVFTNFFDLPRTESVICNRVALGRAVATATMLTGVENTGQWHIGDGSDVVVMPLDAYKLNACGFLKLDVEGYELFALRGARETIDTYKPVVMIEENGLCERYYVQPGAAQNFLESLGYQLAESIGRDLIFEHRSR